MKEDPTIGALTPFDFSQILDEVPELGKFAYRIDSHTFSPLIDSSDVESTLWTDLVTLIEEKYDDYDGFVILHGTDTMAYSASVLSFMLENLTIDYDKRQVTLAGEDIPLTQTEYNILAFLSDHAGKVLTYYTIISSVWGHVDEGSTKKLQVNMANIRKKLGAKPGDNRYIINELGVGYRMLNSQE